MEYTFLADPDLHDKLKTWRPYLLFWFMEGFRMYQADGFKHLSSQCQTWKQELVMSQDTVASFVADHLVKTSNTDDYIDRSSLYDTYKTLYPEEKNKKTSLGKGKWFQLLKQHLGDEGYADSRKLYSDGNRPRQSWCGWRIIM